MKGNYRVWKGRRCVSSYVSYAVATDIKKQYNALGIFVTIEKINSL